jgi:hypothetical protein
MLFDVFGIALAADGDGDDEDALEVHAMALVQSEQVVGPDTGSIGHLLGADLIASAADRLGEPGSAEARARGLAVAAAAARSASLSRACASCAS